MLESLIIHNIFVTGVLIEDIDEMKYQLHHIHLEQCSIQQLHDQDCQHLC